MANGTPSTTGTMLDAWARIITTVGFPVVAASVLIYVLVMQQAKAMGEISAQLNALTVKTDKVQEISQNNYDLAMSRAEQLNEVLSRLRMQMGEDPWVARPKSTTPSPSP